MNARIKEFDFKSSIFYWTLLADKLIKTRFTNFAGAVGSGIRPVTVAGDAAVQCNFKANRTTVFLWSQHQVQITAMEAEHNLAGRRLKHRALGTDVP